MKKLALTAILFFAFAMSGHAQTDKKENKMPEKINEFVTTHFGDLTVTNFKTKAGSNKERYKLTLSDGTELEFDKHQNITEIESEQRLPDNVVNRDIVKYIQKNHPENHMISWELKKGHQVVTLENGLELKFDLDGNFLTIED